MASSTSTNSGSETPRTSAPGQTATPMSAPASAPVAAAAENADDSSTHAERFRSRTTSRATPVQGTSPLPRDAEAPVAGSESRDSNVSASSSSNTTAAPTRPLSSATGSSTPTGSSSTSSGSTARRVQHIPQLQASGSSSIPTPASAVHRSAAGTTASPSAGSSATGVFASRMSAVNSPRRSSALPLGTSSSAAATQHATPAAASAATGAGNEGASGSQNTASSSQTLTQLTAGQAGAAGMHRGVAAPQMFGSYSGGPPSLFTIATGGTTPTAGSTSQPQAQPSTSTANNAASTSTTVRVPIAGYWRAPARPSNAHHAASASGSFAFASANNTTARNALGTATAQRPPQNGFGLAGWPTADPAGWAGNTSEVRRGDFHENSMLSFSWTIQDVALLQEEVERSPALTEEGRSVSAGAGRSEIWTCHPIFGDGRWKLELVRTKRPGDHDAPPGNSPSSEDTSGGTTVLSAYLTSMVIDYNSGDVSIPTQLMFGIKAPNSRSSASGTGSKQWVWTYFTTYTFRREAEFFECHDLPTLSSLLNNPDIARANSFELVVQIGTGPNLAKATSGKETATTASSSSSVNLLSHNPFQMPDARYVPTSMVRGLEGLVDDATTGDVALLVRERGLVPLGARQDEASDVGFGVIPWPVGSPMPNVSDHHGVSDSDVDLTPQIVVRDRVIWAHSSVLAARSEYFRTMLESGFSEGQGFEAESDPNGMSTIGGRRVRVLRIADSDYTTAQALVRYLYVADIDYMESEDVRSASLDDEWMAVGSGNSVQGDGSVRGTASALPVWEWRSLAQIEADEGGNSVVDWAMHAGHPRTPSNSSGVRRSSSRELGAHQQQAGQPPRSLGRSSSSRLSSGNHGRESSSDDANSSSSTTCVASPRASILRSLTQDPHPHPSARTSPASSLGIYRLAHRYNQTCLAARSKDHLVSTLEPSNAFPILLATHLYPELYYSVQKFVLENWDSVSATREFERCCDEVSEGEWGIDAGRALRSFMRSLTSPTAIGSRAATSSSGPTPPLSSSHSAHCQQQQGYYHASRGGQSQAQAQAQAPDRGWRYSSTLYH